MRLKNVTVLGGTGSIGDSTLAVLRLHPDRFRLYALSAYRNLDKLVALCKEFRPIFAVVANEADRAYVIGRLGGTEVSTEIMVGEAALSAIAEQTDVDIVVAAIVGAAGLKPTLAAIHAGKRVLLANKEALVMSGQLFMEATHASGAELLPIDSEHNAIYQCLPVSLQKLSAQQNPLHQGVTRLLLTASGGPFRKFTSEQLASVTPAQACAHPNWSMGQKISVDSATLMNKGLELIEACWLFSLPPEKVQVHIHPESIIHSMVEYADGSILAQMGNPDMCTPIAYGLGWPERIDAGVKALDLFEVACLNFEHPDRERFPCLALAELAFRKGGTAPAILNAANEVAVQSFLEGVIGFTEIPKVIESCLEQLEVQEANQLDTILSADRLSREQAERFIQSTCIA